MVPLEHIHEISVSFGHAKISFLIILKNAQQIDSIQLSLLICEC